MLYWHDIEMADWSRFGKVRVKRKKSASETLTMFSFMRESEKEELAKRRRKAKP